MALIEFKDLPNTDTPINAENLNHNFNEVKVESGSNENGHWIKYEDGTMIISQKFTKSFEINNSTGALYWGQAQNIPNFPINFTELHAISLEVEDRDMISVTPFGSSVNSSAETIYGYSAIAETRTATINVIATGKWK